MNSRLLGFVLALFMGPSVLSVESAGERRPVTVTGTQSNEAIVSAGATMFRERCADCHGADAKGGQGPDLTRLWASADADERVFRAIRSGVTGSIMPPSAAPDSELRAIVAYLRSISVAKLEAPSGSYANGLRLFGEQCARCHRINGHGGFLGPDLSHIPASQSNQLLARAIRDASASFASGFEPVTLTLRDGTEVRGIRKGEDAFSIQIMDTGGRLRGYLKSELTRVTRDKKSLMPDFDADSLSDEELNDVIAFLATFRLSQAR